MVVASPALRQSDISLEIFLLSKLTGSRDPKPISGQAQKRRDPRPQNASVGLRLHLVQNLLNVEGSGFLSLREFFEAHQELSYDGLRWNQNPELIGIPPLVQPGFHGLLEWVLAKINHELHSTRLRDIGPPGLLGSKRHFPIAVAKCVEAAGIVEVENLLAFAGSLAREKIAHVIPVEVNSECLVVGAISFKELLLHVRHTSCGEESRRPILMRGDVV